MARIQVRTSDDGLRREIDSGGFAPTVWYEFSPSGNAKVPPLRSYEFAALALLPLATRKGETLELDFPVDATLLDCLDHYQETWCRWRPDLFPAKTEVIATSEYIRTPRLERPNKAVAAFSAGIDSTF